MGDVLSLVEKAEEAMKDDDAEALMKRIMQEKFDFNDWLKQTKTMTKMGGMSSVSRMIPGKSLHQCAAHPFVAVHSPVGCMGLDTTD